MVGGLPPHFSAVERKLPNLGGNRHGRIERWSDGTGSVTFYAGYDVFDELDDVDFSERQLATAIRKYVLHETKVDPLLNAVSWEEKGVVGPCDQIAVVARLVPQDLLVRAADGSHVVHQ